MKRLSSALLSLTSILLLSSCAAMFSGTSDDVAITAKPEGGFLVLDDERHALPYTADFKKKTKEIRLWHPDYGEQTVQLERKFKTGYLLMDILFTPGWGLVGVLVDGSTGSWYSLPPMIAHDFSKPQPEEGRTDEQGGEVVTAAATAAP